MQNLMPIFFNNLFLGIFSFYLIMLLMSTAKGRKSMTAIETVVLIQWQWVSDGGSIDIYRNVTAQRGGNERERERELISKLINNNNLINYMKYINKVWIFNSGDYWMGYHVYVCLHEWMPYGISFLHTWPLDPILRDKEMRGGVTECMAFLVLPKLLTHQNW